MSDKKGIKKKSTNQKSVPQIVFDFREQKGMVTVQTGKHAVSKQAQELALDSVTRDVLTKEIEQLLSQMDILTTKIQSMTDVDSAKALAILAPAQENLKVLDEEKEEKANSSYNGKKLWENLEGLEKVLTNLTTIFYRSVQLGQNLQPVFDTILRLYNIITTRRL